MKKIIIFFIFLPSICFALNPKEKEVAKHVLGSIVFVAYKNKLDEKATSKMDIKFLGGKIRPNLVYDPKEGNGVGTINVIWSF